MKITFLRLFDNPLSKYRIFKRVSCVQWLFVWFTKVKKGSGNSLRYTFSAWFSNKNVPYLIFSNWAKFQCHLFSFLRYQTKCVIKFFYRRLMTSQTSRFIFHQPLKQWLTGRTRWEEGNTNIWISRERKDLFRWNKKYFS